MKNLSKYLLEGVSKELPKLKTRCQDYNGDNWIVNAMCYADGGAPEGCKSLKELLKEFDWSGAIKADLKELDPDTLIVGCTLEDDDRDRVAWVWGDDGVCYRKKIKEALIKKHAKNNKFIKFKKEKVDEALITKHAKNDKKIRFKKKIKDED